MTDYCNPYRNIDPDEDNFLKIEGKVLTEVDIGKSVIYNDGNKPSQNGLIKSFNDSIVFVVFHCNHDWRNFKDYTGQGCKPEYLKFIQ